MTTSGRHPGVRGEGALSWESLDGSHVAEGGLDSPASTPSPLLPLLSSLPPARPSSPVSSALGQSGGDVGPAQVLASEQELLQGCSCRMPMHGPCNLTSSKLWIPGWGCPFLHTLVIPNTGSALESTLCLLASSATMGSLRMHGTVGCWMG